MKASPYIEQSNLTELALWWYLAPSQLNEPYLLYATSKNLDGKEAIQYKLQHQEVSALTSLSSPSPEIKIPSPV